MDTEKTKIENEIAAIIKDDNGCETRFECENVTFTKAITTTVNDKGKEFEWPATQFIFLKEVRAITFNPITKESFLLYKGVASDEVEGLNKILYYVKNHRTTNYSHTVTWSNKKEGKTYTSYFYAKDALQALEKFFHGKIREEYTIFNVKLNPLA